MIGKKCPKCDSYARNCASPICNFCGYIFKGAKICNSCNTVNYPNRKTCYECGTVLSEPEPKTEHKTEPKVNIYLDDKVKYHLVLTNKSFNKILESLNIKHNNNYYIYIEHDSGTLPINDSVTINITWEM